MKNIISNKEKSFKVPAAMPMNAYAVKSHNNDAQ